MCVRVMRSDVRVMCVCVDHLNRCKTSIRYFGALFFVKVHDFLVSISRRGAQKAHRAVPNEALYGVLRISRLITWTYLHPIFNSFDVTFPKWRPAKPRTGMSNVKPKFDFACTVFAI